KADFGFEGAPKLDVMMVPGGAGTMAQLENPVLLEFLKRQDSQTEFTASVCTGSALLAKAGLLKGRRATTNKAYFSLATGQDASVRWMRRARWVEDGKFFTSSGVSAGTDMALGLVARIYGRDHARALARSLEYQWSEDADHDPFALP
ncbi:MAG: DJ-1/PfpI family protein, partial [Caulobacteraceae bacterium]|nr:DJ-1/PfpI family protein [Caulobacteraceae bacterium]